MLEQLKFIAMGAGELMKKPDDIKVYRKSGRQNYVTSIDFACQEYIVKNLSRFFSGINIITEESDSNRYDPSQPAFVVDPVDGTTNLLYGLRMSAVSIGYYKQGRPLCAVVFNPFMDELFWALRGEGAFLNGDAIHVTNSQAADALVGFGTVPYDRGMAGVTFGIAAEIFKSCRELRRSGSAALDLCYVACGRLDAFYELALHPWDFAAGRLIVEEAGGRFSTVRGKPVPFTLKSSILATNSVCHDDMLRFFSDVTPPCDGEHKQMIPKANEQPDMAKKPVSAPKHTPEAPDAAAPKQPQNPWLHVKLEDYETHMSAPGVGQLKALNMITLDQMMEIPYDNRPTAVVAVLGVAGGNGLEHAGTLGIGGVLGFDINDEYIKACRKRFASMRAGLALQKLDVAADPQRTARLLRSADLIIANLLLEYIGLDDFMSIITVLPQYGRIISCVIQEDVGASESESAPMLEGVARAMRMIDAKELTARMEQAGYYRSYMTQEIMPDGKVLRRLDYRNEWNA